MRLIDADVAMERMKLAYEDMGVDTHGIWNKQLAEIFKAEETDLDDIRLCLCSILGAVAQAPTVDRPQEWIPCSERLPKPYTEVLVCDECGWISLGSYRPCDVTEKDSGWRTITRIKIPTDGIIAWMSLPKPWKKE